MIELDFAPVLRPAGGSRHLASEDELELLTSYFLTSARFAVDATTVFAAEATLLEFTRLVLDAAVAVDSRIPAQVGPEFSSDQWSVTADRDQVRIGFCRYERESERDVTGAVTIARTPLLSASAAFVLRALAAAERQDAAVAQNPLVRRMRAQARDLLDRHLDRSIVKVTIIDPDDDRPRGMPGSAMAERLAYRIWSYGGLPAAVPSPVEVEVLVAPAGSGETDVAATIAAGRPRIEVVAPPEPLAGDDSFAELVRPGFAELLELFGTTATVLYRALARAGP